MLKPKAALSILYRALYNTIYHDGIEHAGYLAFLGLLAMFPFLVFLVALAGFVGEQQLGAQVLLNFVTKYTPDLTSALKPRIVEILSGPPPQLLTVSIVGAIWTSSSAVEGMRTVLNRAYHVGTPPAYILRRLLSIFYILILTLIVMIGMGVLVLLPILWERVQEYVHISPTTIEAWGRLSFCVIALMLFLVVGTFYYVLPNIRQSLRAVVPGAAVVAVLWMFAGRLFSAYLQNFQQVNLIYGSLGGIIAALVFFYINNIIFIFGAELNYLLMRAHGDKIEQKEHTVDEEYHLPKDNPPTPQV